MKGPLRLSKSKSCIAANIEASAFRFLSTFVLLSQPHAAEFWIWGFLLPSVLEQERQMSLAKEHVETRNAPWSLLPSPTALAEKGCSPSPCWPHCTEPCSEAWWSIQLPALREHLCRAFGLLHGAGSGWMQTQPPCVRLSCREHRPDLAWLTWLGRTWGSCGSASGMCSPGCGSENSFLHQSGCSVPNRSQKPCFCQGKKSTAPDCCISNFSGITAATETGRNSLLHLWACSLLSLSTCEQSQVLPLSLEDFLCNPDKTEVFQQYLFFTPWPFSHVCSSLQKPRRDLREFGQSDFVPLPVWALRRWAKWSSSPP